MEKRGENSALQYQRKGQSNLAGKNVATRCGEEEEEGAVKCGTVIGVSGAHPH